MPDDVSKPTLQVKTAAQAAARANLEASPQPDVDPVQAARDFMDRHPTLLAKPRPGRDPMAAADDFIVRYPVIMARLAE